VYVCFGTIKCLELAFRVTVVTGRNLNDNTGRMEWRSYPIEQTTPDSTY